MFRIFLALFLISSSLKASDETAEDSTFYFLKEFINLDWKTSGNCQLSNGYFSIPKNRIALDKKESQQFRKICTDWIGINRIPIFEHVESIICDYNFEDYILFEEYNVGYIPLNEWENIDSDNLLEQIRQYIGKMDDKCSIESTLIEWIQKPTVDKDTYTIRWALETMDEYGDSTIFTTVIKLHRFGYTKITHLIDRDLYDPFNEEFYSIVSSYNANPGTCYLDFSKKDKIASLDIKALAQIHEF